MTSFYTVSFLEKLRHSVCNVTTTVHKEEEEEEEEGKETEEE
jgi:hypothetical protein